MAVPNAFWFFDCFGGNTIREGEPQEALMPVCFNKQMG